MEQSRQLEIETQRHDAIDSTLAEGSWSMNVVGRDPSNSNNAFWWSQQFRRLLGYKDENDFPNVLNSWSDKLHPEDKQAALDAFSKHVNDYSGNTPFDLEYRLRRKDGTYRWFRANGTTVRESDGTPIVVAGSILAHTAPPWLTPLFGSELFSESVYDLHEFFHAINIHTFFEFPILFEGGSDHGRIG